MKRTRWIALVVMLMAFVIAPTMGIASPCNTSCGNDEPPTLVAKTIAPEVTPALNVDHLQNAPPSQPDCSVMQLVFELAPIVKKKTNNATEDIAWNTFANVMTTPRPDLAFDTSVVPDGLDVPNTWTPTPALTMGKEACTTAFNGAAPIATIENRWTPSYFSTLTALTQEGMSATQVPEVTSSPRNSALAEITRTSSVTNQTFITFWVDMRTNDRAGPAFSETPAVKQQNMFTALNDATGRAGPMDNIRTDAATTSNLAPDTGASTGTLQGATSLT